MTKQIIIVSALIFFLSGCALFQRSGDVPTGTAQEIAMDKIIGVVSRPQDQAVLSAPTKFILLSEDGQKIYIDSISVNLKRYGSRRVEVEGKWNDEKTILNVENVVSLGRDTAVKQAYQNSEIGLKFSYPSVWSLKNEINSADRQRILLTPYDVENEELADVDNIIIDRLENTRRISSREWLNLDELYRPGNPEDQNVYQQSTIGLAQLPAVKKTYRTGNKVEFFVDRDLFMYEFAFATVDDADKDISRNVFYEIISSFEFIPIIMESPVGTTTGTASQPLAARMLNDIEPRALTAQNTSAISQSGGAGPTGGSTNAATSSQGETRRTFIDYIKSNINNLAPEPAQSGGYEVSRIEFALSQNNSDNFTAIYATYRDSAGQPHRILLQVNDLARPQNMTVTAYFQTGESSDWQLVSGVDTARNSERVVVNVEGAASNSAPIIIRSGMRLLEARSFNIKIQYPSNWYWAHVSGGYNFSNRPISGENVLLRLTKNPSSLPETMEEIESINGLAAIQGFYAESFSICVQGRNKYCLSGAADDGPQTSIARQMLATLVEE